MSTPSTPQTNKQTNNKQQQIALHTGGWIPRALYLLQVASSILSWAGDKLTSLKPFPAPPGAERRDAEGKKKEKKKKGFLRVNVLQQPQAVAYYAVMSPFRVKLVLLKWFSRTALTEVKGNNTALLPCWMAARGLLMLLLLLLPNNTRKREKKEDSGPELHIIQHNIWLYKKKKKRKNLCCIHLMTLMHLLWKYEQNIQWESKIGETISENASGLHFNERNDVPLDVGEWFQILLGDQIIIIPESIIWCHQIIALTVTSRTWKVNKNLGCDVL